MVFGIGLLFVLFILWVLFVKGILFKIILFFAGWVGLYVIMNLYVIDSDKIAITVSNYQFSWAVLVPTVICVLALLTSKSE
jgi:hypothetical protein